jgi:arylsulfatase
MCDLAGAKAPTDIDGISLVPTLLGQSGQTRHEFLYWEFPSAGGQQAVRLGDWKGIRTNLNKTLSDMELYNLAADPNEQHNVAQEQPELVARVERIMREQHVTSAEFPIKSIDGPAISGKAAGKK